MATGWGQGRASRGTCTGRCRSQRGKPSGWACVFGDPLARGGRLEPSKRIRVRPGIRHFDGEPFCQSRVDFDWSLLSHPVAEEYNDLGEVGAVMTHRLGEAGVDRLAGV